MDTASLVLVVLRLSEAKNKHTVSQSPVWNVSVKPCWLTRQATKQIWNQIGEKPILFCT